MQDLNLNKKEDIQMKATNKSMKHARLILMAVLALGVLSLGVHPQPASAVADPWIPVTECGAVLDMEGGQYRLTGDLTGCTGYGVRITANDVHFNLDGFKISGPSDGTGTGIQAWGKNAHIHSGIVEGFSVGILLGWFASEDQFCHVNEMTVIGNSYRGIYLFYTAYYNTITGNTAFGNGIDLYDVASGQSGCVNQWSGNTFETDSEGDGPGAGCIR